MSLSTYAAAGRIAWRQSIRSPWRTALIVAMIALPIAGLSLAAVVIRAAIPTIDDRVRSEFGTADISIYGSPKLSVDVLARELPVGAKLVEGRYLSSSNVAGGSVVNLDIRQFSVPIDRPPVQGMFAMLEGDAPTRPGEVALQPGALAAFGVRIGDTLSLEHPALTLHVTGTVVAPEHLGEPVAILGPGTLTSGRLGANDSVLVDLPPGVPLAEGLARLAKDKGVRAGGYSDPATAFDQLRDTQVATAESFAAAVLVLLATGLIAGAAVAVGARRQLRTLGLIGAVGGEPRHIRATVLFGGLTLGALGSLIGVCIGIAAAYILQPHLGRFAGRLVGPVELPIVPLVGAVGLGTFAATLAAYGPARSAARLTTVQALAGRTPPPRSPSRRAMLGLGAVVAGAAVTSWATREASDPWLTIGLAAMIVGFLVAIPLLVTIIGRGAGVLPMVPRLATRDIARHGRRTGAALAAATLALALPVGTSALTLSQEALDRRVPYIGADQLEIVGVGGGTGLEQRMRALVTDLHRAFPDAVIAPYVPAVRTVGRADQQRERLVYAQAPEQTDSNGSTYMEFGLLEIGGPDLLRAFHAEAGIPALEAGKVVGIGPGTVDGGSVHLTSAQGSPTTSELQRDVSAVEAGSTRYLGLGSTTGLNYVISAPGASQLGFRQSSKPTWASGFILRSPQPLDADQITQAKQIASPYAGATVESAGDFESHAGDLRLVVAGVGAVLALAIVGVIVALVAAEARREQAILVAVGAEPRIRRAVAGVGAAVVAVSAGLLAVPAGFAPAVVFRSAQRIGYPIVVPWATIGLVLIGIPLVAGTLAAIISRQPRAAQLLHPIAE